MYLVLYYQEVEITKMLVSYSSSKDVPTRASANQLQMKIFDNEAVAIAFSQKYSGYIVKALQIKSTIEEDK